MRFKIRLAALLGAVGVVLGAMGAHGAVHEKLQATGGAEHWSTAGDYHLLHAVALLVMALLAEKSKALRVGWWCMCAGIFIFSGTLYVLALTQMKWLGAITPIGGLALIVGWLLTALGAGGVTVDQAATKS
jgi:uncharacterized membrane protein YgdD (TMEM256/DUF423 family)